MKKIFFLAVAALALASCDNNEDNQPASDEAMKISATIGESAVSRAGDDSWATGDNIGITSSIGGVLRPYINLKYEYDPDAVSGSNFKGTPIFFYKPMILTAYYPFAGKEGEVPGDNGNGIIKAITSAENQTQDKQPLIDFLWDSKKGKGVDKDQVDFSVTDNTVKFTFAHMMSKLTFTFLDSPPFEYLGIKYPGVNVKDMISYEIEGLGLEGTFDTATGVCGLDPDKGRPGLAIDVENKVENEKELPSLIVFPQSKPTDGNFILHITTDELNDEANLQKYKCQLRFGDNEIKAGYHYKFRVKVTKYGLIIGDLTIEPWQGQDKFLIATVDGDENPFKPAASGLQTK